MRGETTVRLDGRTALITGAAGLIGSALCRGFAANGAQVIMVDRDAAGWRNSPLTSGRRPPAPTAT